MHEIGFEPLGNEPDAVIGKANEMIRAQSRGPGAVDPSRVGFLPLKGNEKGYVINLPTSTLPMPDSAAMKPSVAASE